MLQVKGDETIVPGGGTIIEANDRLLIFARKDDRDRIRALFSVTAPSG